MKTYLLAAVFITAALTAPSPSAAALADAPWPMYQKDMFHTGGTTLRGPDIGTAAVLFAADVEGAPSCAVFDAAGTAYVGSADGCVYAVSPEGEAECIFNTGWPVTAAPVLTDDGTLYVGTDNGTLFALSTDGSPLKEPLDLGNGIVSAPAVGPSGSVFVGTAGKKNQGTLYCISSQGEIIWSYDTGRITYSSPAVDAPGNVYVGSHAGIVYSLTRHGSLRWTYETGETIMSSPVIDPGGTIYIATSSKLIAISSSGDMLWTFIPSAPLFGMEEQSGFVAGPAIDQEGNLYAAGVLGDLHCIDSSGEERWRIMLNEPTLLDPVIPVVLSPPIVSASPERENGNYLYVRVKNTLYLCDLSTESISSFPLADQQEQGSGTDSTEPAIALGLNRMLYIPSLDGFLYAVGPDPAQGFSIGGTVDGIPDDYSEASRKKIRVYISEGQNSIEALIDGQGRYTAAGLDPGTYTVSPEAAGLRFDPPGVQVRISLSDRNDVDFSVSSSAPYINRAVADPETINSTSGNKIVLYAEICNTGDKPFSVTADLSAVNGSAELEMAPATEFPGPWETAPYGTLYYAEYTAPAGLSLGPKSIPVTVSDSMGTIYDKGAVIVDTQNSFSGDSEREFMFTIKESIPFLLIQHRLGSITATAAVRSDSLSSTGSFELTVFAPGDTPVPECSAVLTSELQTCEIAEPAAGSWRLVVSGTGAANTRTQKNGSCAGGMQTGSQYSISTATTGLGIVFGNVADAASGQSLNDIQIRTTSGASATAQDGYYLMLSPAGAFTVTTQDLSGSYVPAAKSVSLMSGDTAEANFLLNQGGGGSAESCPVEELLGSSSSETCSIRNFRDSILSHTAAGRRYIDIYYRHAAELLTIMDSDPALKNDIRSLIVDLLPLITALADGRPCRLTGPQKALLLNCLSGVGKHAGPGLTAQLDTLIETINAGKGLFTSLSGKNRLLR